MSHFNVSLIVWAKSQDSVHKPHFLTKKESRSGSNRGPSAYQPSSLSLGHTGSLLRSRASRYFRRCSPPPPSFDWPRGQPVSTRHTRVTPRLPPGTGHNRDRPFVTRSTACEFPYPLYSYTRASYVNGYKNDYTFTVTIKWQQHKRSQYQQVKKCAV